MESTVILLTRSTLRQENGFRPSFWSSMKKQQLRLWKQWKQQNKGTDPGNREKERRYRRNCRCAYLRYLFVQRYLTVWKNHAMVVKLEGFYSFRFYGILPGDGLFLGHHVIPMSITSKRQGEDAYGIRASAGRRLRGFFSCRQKPSERILKKKGAAHGEASVCFRRQ